MRSFNLLALVLLAAATGNAIAEPPKPNSHWQQKQFLISFWIAPPATDEHLARVAAEGYNLTWVPLEGLDVAQRHGLRAMLTSELLRPETLDDPAKRAELDAFIEKVKSHPALEVYFITDEPSAGAFAGLGKLVAYLRERDPQHLAYINLFPTYANEKQLGVSVADATKAKVTVPETAVGVKADDAVVLRYLEHLRQYVETVKPDLISYDHYHFFKNADGSDKDGKEYFLNLGLIRKAALDAGKPFLNIIQADTIIESWRMPKANEERWLAFTTLAYGGRGIAYFTYWGPKAYGGLYQDGVAAPLAKDVAALNHEIAKFGVELMKLDSLGAYQTEPVPYGGEAVPADCSVQFEKPGEFVLGVFGNEGKASSFMVVNRNYRQEATAHVKVRIPGSALEELDRTTGGWKPFEKLDGQRTVEVKLAAGDGRLFRVAK